MLADASPAWGDADEARLARLLEANYGGEGLDAFIRRVSPRHPPPRHIKPIIDLWERTRHERVLACVEVPPRHAKLVADSTPVLTPDGWRTHGDLRVGDYVYAPDGSPTRVRYVTEKQEATLAVRFSDDEVIRVNPGHRWRVFDRSQHKWRVLETGELVEIGLNASDTKRDGSPRGRFLVDTARAVQGQHVDLPIDPYVFGLWLGDGSTGNGRITGADPDVEHHKAEVTARGYSIGATNVHPTTGVVTFCVLGMRVRSVVGDTKFVPDVYYRADEEQRRELLRGLIDSDGCVDPNGRCRFVNSNRRLIDGVARLVASLGYRLTVQHRPSIVRPYPFNVCQESWCVAWTPTDGAQPARLPRKDRRVNALERKRSIVSIEPCTPEPGHCIEVEHESHCYLVGDRCVPTHNTTTGLHALAWRLRRDPSLMNAFATFGDPFAASRSRICRTMYRGAGGVIPRDASNLHEWMTPHGGGLLAHGYHGEWTGRGITGVALIDDLYKDRIAAESETIRENVWDWFTDVLWTRLENASCIVQFTRWHDDDLIGRLLQGKFKGYRFEEIRLPAIAEEDDILGRAPGEALWPERPEFSAPELHKIRDSIGPYSWASLYQQRPRPRGAELFVQPHRFSLASWKPDGHRILLCCDPAATEDTRADFSAAFVLAAKGFGEDMVVWVLHGWRHQVSVPKVARKLLELSNRYWRAPVAIESVGAFKGVPQMLKEIEPRLRIKEIKPVGDKFTRAQAVAAAWNTGRVLVPYDAELDWNPAANHFGRYVQVGNDLMPTNEPVKLRPGVPAGTTWADELSAECLKFTGVKDVEDDQVDALAHGFNTLWGIKQAVHGERRNQLPFG